MDEFPRFSVLDFVRGLEKSEVCRFSFCASLTSPGDEVFKFFSQYASQHFADDVTGLLLVYPDYVVHLLESPEEKIFEMCLDFVNATPKFLGVSRCFPVETDVAERFFVKWHARKIDGISEPSRVIEIPRATEELNFDDVRQFYCRLIDDLYSLYDELRRSRAISRAHFSDALDSLVSRTNPLLPNEEALRTMLENPWADSLESLVNDYWNGVCEKEIDEVIWPFPRSQCPAIELDATEESSARD